MRRLVLLLIAMPMLALSFGPLVRNMMLEIASRDDAVDLGPVTDGLVAYWSMRESSGTVFDETGNSDGSVQGGVTFGSAIAVRGSSAELNGSTGYIQTGESDMLLENPVSLSFWARSRDVETGARGGVISAYNLDDGTDELTLVQVNAEMWAISMESGSPSQATWGNMVADTWYHFVAVYSAPDKREIYVNGEWKAQNTTTRSPTGKATFRIGLRAAAVSQYFDGYIDEGRAYNRAITQEEITALYNHDKDGAGH